MSLYQIVILLMEQQEIEDYYQVGYADNDSQYSPDFEEQQRSQSAPPGPLKEMDQFKRSKEFKVLQQATVCSNHIVPKGYNKFDLESDQDLNIFRRFLGSLEKLCGLFKVHTVSREYRNTFSNAYKILYEENSLCYLTQILDSAQECYPYLWVNGQKFLFSKEVLQGGQRLISQFFSVQHVLRNSYSKICNQRYCNLQSIKFDICSTLEVFDVVWTQYEKTYIKQLMNIETQARRFIVNAIDLQKCLGLVETRQKLRGKIFVSSQQYIKNRRKLCQMISKINSVANVEGKGRDDLDYQILFEAQSILRRVTKHQSQAVRNLAQKIRNSFNKLRQLLRKYDEGIESVDPQLRNNRDLVQALVQYQTSWQKGKNYFLDANKCNCLIHFSHIIETTSQKYKSFKIQVEIIDADIFVSIPSLLILRNLDNQDRKIVGNFLPFLFLYNTPSNTLYVSLQEQFLQFKKKFQDKYLYYNTIEKKLIGIDLEEAELKASQNFQGFEIMVNKIKRLAMELNRSNPLEWNSMIGASMQILEQ